MIDAFRRTATELNALSRRFMIAGALGAMLTPAHVHAQEVSAGIVDRVSGTWTRLRDGRVLQPGDSFRAGDAVAAETEGRLSVMMFGSGDVASHQCSPLRAECRFFRIPVERKSAEGFLAYLSRLFTTERVRPVSLAVVRSLSPLGPAHGLVQLHQGRADLEPMLKALPPGDYHLDLVPLDAGQAQRIRWSSAAPAHPPLEPGLYTLRVTDLDGAARGSASVVLALEKPAPETTRSWQEFMTLTAQWQSMSKEAVDIIAFRVLRDLADRHGR